MIEKKVVTKPINYDILNKLSTDFETWFVSQTESSAEQDFWSQYSVQIDEPNLSGTTIVELKFQRNFLKSAWWGFEHTKACFCDDIIPFVQSLKELFTSFDQWLIDEVTEVQNVFTQMKLAVEQHSLSVEIMNIVVHENMKSVYFNVTACARCVTTKSELKPDSLKKECYDMLIQKYHTLEKHCITLEVNNQLNTELFQRDTWSSQESAPTFAELFEITNLKAQSQAKDTVILKLKEKLNSLNGDVKDRDSSRVRSKEQCDDLIKKVNIKSAEVSDLNARLHEKVLVITALKEQLDKLKGKA
nr:hypothetical protein [Tanacetum cinerariifolium]